MLTRLKQVFGLTSQKNFTGQLADGGTDAIVQTGGNGNGSGDITVARHRAYQCAYQCARWHHRY